MSNPEMSRIDGATFIQEKLISGKMIMKEVCKETGWSFPRVRSCAKTICKRLGCIYVRESVGVYYADPIDGTKLKPMFKKITPAELSNSPIEDEKGLEDMKDPDNLEDTGTPELKVSIEDAEKLFNSRLT